MIFKISSQLFFAFLLVIALTGARSDDDVRNRTTLKTGESATTKNDNSSPLKILDLTTSETLETSTPIPVVPKFCEEKTACMWRVYGKNLDKRVNLVIKNKQCVCSESMSCAFSEDSLSMGAFVYRCNSTLIS